MSRKAKRLSLSFIYDCGKLGMTYAEIASLCGLSESAISIRLGPTDRGHDPEWDPKLKEAFRAGRAELSKSLRRAQIESALGTPDRIVKTDNGDGTEKEEFVKGRCGNPVSQIWLGKQLLGQTDHAAPPAPAGTTNIFIAQWGGAPQDAIQAPAQPVLPTSDGHDQMDKSQNPDSIIDAEADEISTEDG
jgi:hypothetical protein